MPKGTKVERLYSRLRDRGYSEASAAKIAQKATHLSLATGKPPKKCATCKKYNCVCPPTKYAAKKARITDAQVDGFKAEVARLVDADDPMGVVAGFAVWKVDGDTVKIEHSMDFVEGGNSFKWPFVPAGEIWIDEDLAEHDWRYVVLHEAIEATLMQQDMAYDEAHKIANEHERAWRLEHLLHGMVESCPCPECNATGCDHAAVQVAKYAMGRGWVTKYKEPDQPTTGEKHWITIGGHPGPDGRHVGGVHVEVEGGTIVTGPDKMVGNSPENPVSEERKPFQPNPNKDQAFYKNDPETKAGIAWQRWKRKQEGVPEGGLSPDAPNAPLDEAGLKQLKRDELAKAKARKKQAKSPEELEAAHQARKAKKAENTKASRAADKKLLQDEAAKLGVKPAELLAAAKGFHAQQQEGDVPFNAALANVYAKMGLKGGKRDVEKIKNQSWTPEQEHAWRTGAKPDTRRWKSNDRTAIQGFDTAARELAAEHPELGIGRGAVEGVQDETDTDRLWELMGEGPKAKGSWRDHISRAVEEIVANNPEARANYLSHLVGEAIGAEQEPASLAGEGEQEGAPDLSDDELQSIMGDLNAGMEGAEPSAQPSPEEAKGKRLRKKPEPKPPKEKKFSGKNGKEAPPAEPPKEPPVAEGAKEPQEPPHHELAAKRPLESDTGTPGERQKVGEAITTAQGGRHPENKTDVESASNLRPVGTEYEAQGIKLRVTGHEQDANGKWHEQSERIGEAPKREEKPQKPIGKGKVTPQELASALAKQYPGRNPTAEEVKQMQQHLEAMEKKAEKLTPEQRAQRRVEESQAKHKARGEATAKGAAAKAESQKAVAEHRAQAKERLEKARQDTKRLSEEQRRKTKEFLHQLRQKATKSDPELGKLIGQWIATLADDLSPFWDIRNVQRGVNAHRNRVKSSSPTLKSGTHLPGGRMLGT